MSGIELLFSKELYEDKALADAAEAFRDFVKISVMPAGEHHRMRISPLSARKGVDKMVVGEILNFVLARTVELRGKQLG